MTKAGFYQIVYKVRSTGAIVCQNFESRYAAWKFFQKLTHSKRCDLVSYPNFND